MGSAASVFSSRDSDDEVTKERVKEIAGDRYDEDEFAKISGGKNWVVLGDFKKYLLALEVLDENKCKITIEEVREIAGEKFDESEYRKLAGSNGCLSMNTLKKFLLILEDPRDISLPYEAIKSLWFSSTECGRGKCLVDIKDTVVACDKIFKDLFMRYASDPTGMSLSEFNALVVASNCGLDADVVNSHFFECTKFPDDEDDTEEVSAIRADIGRFISALIRVANAVDIQNNGIGDNSIRKELADWLTSCASSLQLDASQLAACLSDGTLRDPAFFSAPPDFIGTKLKVFLNINYDGTVHRIVVELNAEITPNTAYNFKCLCTGERGVGELTGRPLTLKGTTFHRIVDGMCVQGGDIEGSDGFGGESVYGGEFNDENFTIKHDAAGIVSMGNQGPNSNTSQFFITLAPSPHLDGENVAFGRVVEGMELISLLGSVPVNEDSRPTQDIEITDCGIVNLVN